MSYNRYIDSPKKLLAWKRVTDYVLRTPLGEDDCSVLVAEVGRHRVLKEGEDERIRRAQAKIFCQWLIEEREEFVPEQLEYLLYAFEIRQAHLAKALVVEASAVSQFLKGYNKFKKSTHRELAILFILEVDKPGLIKSLSKDSFPDLKGCTFRAGHDLNYGNKSEIQFSELETYPGEITCPSNVGKAA